MYAECTMCFRLVLKKKSKSIGLLVTFIKSICFQATVPKICTRFYFVEFVAEKTQESPQYPKVYSVEL